MDVQDNYAGVASENLAVSKRIFLSTLPIINNGFHVFSFARFGENNVSKIVYNDSNISWWFDKNLATIAFIC